MVYVRLGDDQVADIAQQTADRLAARKPAHPAAPSPEPLIDVNEVARRAGRKPAWVRDHKDEFGVIRIGKGPRPRLRFDPARVDEVLLDAASELDREDRANRRFRRPLLAALAYGGLRIGELLALRWRDVDLANGKMYVRESKTDAGVRTVDIQPELREELVAVKADTPFSEPNDLVFPTSTGRADNRNNVRRRVLVRAVERANGRIAASGGCEPLPERLSPHALRRTFASWLVAEGEDIAYVMAQLGHTDPQMTLGLYAKALRSKRRRPHAKRVERTPEWAPMGTSAADADVQESGAHSA